ncbi:MAG: DMT family transporter [Gammaproteobacteria bacterium]|nr:DMT family transporter [Gammaproteobacteria bacterium]
MARGHSLAHLQLLGTVLAWAANFHFGKYAVGLMAPLGAGLWRFLPAAAVLLPVMLWREPLAWAALRRNLVPLLVMGVVGICGFNLGMFYGLRYTSAMNAALIGALNPAMIVVLAAILHREPVGGRRLGGLLLGLAGVLVVVSRGSWSALRALEFSHGDLLLLAGGCGWAVYSVVPRLYIRGLGPLQMAGVSILFGVLAMLAVAPLLDPQSLAPPPLAAWPALVFMGVFGAALAYLWWNQGIVRVGPQRAAIYLNLIPVATAGMGLLLGQTVSLAQMAGAVLVIAGVLIAASAAR